MAMINEILNSPVIPGSASSPQKEHAQMKILLAVLVIGILVFIGVYYWQTSIKTSLKETVTTRPNIESPVITQLRETPIPSPDQASAIVNELKKNKDTTTQIQKDDIIKQLKAL